MGSFPIKYLKGYWRFFCRICSWHFDVLLIGSSHLLEEIIATPLELLRPIPAVAWIPTAILMFPDAEIGMFYITFVGVFYPILVSTQKQLSHHCLIC